MYRSHRIRLDPTQAQVVAFQRHAGYARVAYNWAVREFLASWLSDVNEWCGAYTLIPRFNAIKLKISRWNFHKELSQNASKGAIEDAGNAIKLWGKYCKAVKAGQKTRYVGKPSEKKFGSRPAFRADHGDGKDVKCNGKTIKLPKIGVVKMREVLRWQGEIVSVCISKRAGHWYASITVNDGLPTPSVSDNGRPAVGVDVGLKTLAVCSDGVEYANPKPLVRLQSRLRRASKSLSRKEKGSQNWHKQVAAVARLHARIANMRSDYAHKATTAIVNRAGAISVETLNVAGMMQNRRLSKAFADAEVSEFLRQLEYKAAWAGVAFRRVDRWYPSSKLCHHCGIKNDTLTLAQREWWCGGCGVRVDRDFNASLNIRDYDNGRGQTASACGDRVSPAVTPSAVVCEAGMGILNSQLRLC